MRKVYGKLGGADGKKGEGKKVTGAYGKEERKGKRRSAKEGKEPDRVRREGR